MGLKTSTQKHWSFQDAGLGVIPSACLIGHTLWAVGGSNINGYDLFTGTKRAISFTPHHGGPRHLARWQDKLIAATAQGHIVACDPQSGASIDLFQTGYVTWMESFGGNLYLAAPDSIQYLPSGGTTPADKQFPFTPRTAPCFGNGLLLVAYLPKHSDQNHLAALDPLTLAPVWTIDLPAMPTTGLISDDAAVYFSSGDTVYAVDLHTRSLRWQKRLDVEVTANLCFDQATVFASGTNTLVGLDKTDGTTSASFAIKDTPSQFTFQEEGIVYLAGNKLTAVSITDRNTLEEEIKAPILVGVADGMVICVGSGEAMGISFKESLRAFYVESRLMQDFNFDNPDGEIHIATYQTELTLTDERGGPRVNHKVHVWASEGTTISMGGTPVAVDSQTYAEGVTDASGRLRIISEADGFHTPGLLIWAAFMEEGEHILVTPSYQIHDRLSGLSGDDLRDGVDFAGNPILNNEYREDSRKRNAVAQAIAQTTGLAKQANINRDALDKYTAEGCPEGAVCCVTGGRYEVTMTCEQPYLLDLSSAQSSCTDLTPEQVSAWRNANPNSQPPNLISLQQRGLHLNLWRALADGHIDLKKMLIHTLEDAAQSVEAVVTYVWQGVEYVATGIIDSLEKAMLLVGNLFEKICTSLKSAVEAFSFLFSWERIKQLTGLIGDHVGQAWQSFFEGGYLDHVQSTVVGGVTQFKNNIDQTFDQINEMFGSKSPLGHQQAATAGKSNPAAGGTQGNWLTQRVTQTALPSGEVQTGHFAQRGIALDVPELPLGTHTLAAIDSFLAELETSVSADVKATLTAVLTDLKSGSATNLLSQAAGVLIHVFKGAADVLLDVAVALLDLFFNLFRALWQDGVFDGILNMPMAIPYISDLFQQVVGLPLNMKNLIGLMVAVPISLWEKATGNTLFSKKRSTRGDISKALSFVGNTGQIIWGAVSGALGLIPTPQEEIPGQVTKSEIANLKVGFCVANIIFVRGSYLGAILFNDTDSDKIKSEKLGIWMGPTLAIPLNIIYAFANDCEAKYKVPGAVLLGVLGCINVGLLVGNYLSDNKFTENYYVFAGLVTLPLFLNAAMLLRDSYAPLRVIVSIASGLTIAISGIVGQTGLDNAPAPALQLST